MTNPLSRIAFLVLLLFTASSWARGSLTPYVAEYELLRGGSVAGVATITLEHGDEGQWRMRDHARGTQGLALLAGFEVDQVSHFRQTSKGLACESFRYRQTGLRKREREVTCSDGAGGIVSRDHRGEYRFDAQAGVIDRQTVSVAIGLDLAAGKRGTLSYQVVDREQLERNRYRVKGEETVEVPYGRVRALKVERLREDSARNTTLWFGPDQGMVPVRIAQNDGSEGFELRLVSLRR